VSPRVCVLTPSGRGAVAVVAVDGVAAVSAVNRYFQAANKRNLSEQTLGRIVYGHWGDEDLILCRRDEQALEIHCHGGRQSSAQIVADLANAGCTVVEAEEWLTNQHNCPLTTAAHLALAKATTLRTATILLAQYHGALRREIEGIISGLSVGQPAQSIARLEHLLQSAELGRHLTVPWRVVIAGQPNVGKSSLINALVGFQRAIVFDQPGTTRDVVSSTTAVNGWPVELSDMAGLHETTDAIEIAGIALACERILAADLVVWVLDATTVSSTTEDHWQLAKQQAQAVGVFLDQKSAQLVINKMDLADFTFSDKNNDKISDPFSVGTCAVTGEGVEPLLSAIATRLVPEVPSSGAAVPFTIEQIESLQAALDAANGKDFTAATETLNPLITVAPGSAGG